MYVSSLRVVSPVCVRCTRQKVRRRTRVVCSVHGVFVNPNLHERERGGRGRGGKGRLNCIICYREFVPCTYCTGTRAASDICFCSVSRIRSSVRSLCPTRSTSSHGESQERDSQLHRLYSDQQPMKNRGVELPDNTC